MEAVEYLVVGENAVSQVVVGKTLVKRFFYRRKEGCVATGTYGKNLLQTLILLLAVGKDEDTVTLQEEILKRLLQHVEVLVEERLYGDIEPQGGLWLLRGPMAELYPTEVFCISHKLSSGDQLRIATQLALDVTLFHLGGLSHLLHTGLLGETFLVGPVDSITHIKVVFHHEQRLLGDKRQERHLVASLGSQFRNNLYTITAILRQLILHLERTNGVNIVTEEIDTIRILATVRIDIEDRTAKGKLSWFIDIVNLTKPKLPEAFLHLSHIDGLPLFQGESAGIETLL